MASPIVPMSSPDITDLEREAIAAVLRTSHLSMGSEITGFEQAFKEYTRCRYAIGVSSGTAGLHLCIRAVGITEGEVVITTPFSFVSSTNVILYERGMPVFVDVDPITGNMDVQAVRQAVHDLFKGGQASQKWFPRKAIGKKAHPKAILTVDVFGQPADADPILEVAQAYDLQVIEDSCEALGASYKDRSAGILGNYAVFAFYPNKQITTGEGGVIVTDDDYAAELMCALRNQGRAPGDTWLQHTHLGYNYRLDEMSAALGRIQMTRLDELLKRRQQVADWYNYQLAKVPGVECPQVSPNTTRMSWFVYIVRFEAGINRERVASMLEKQGIPTRPYFTPIHLQPYMVEKFGYRQGDFPITEDLGKRSLALPFSGVMSEEQVDIVCDALRKVL
jgi:dTDP-4-amino-4,6-dideoxygalactose transaminase